MQENHVHGIHKLLAYVVANETLSNRRKYPYNRFALVGTNLTCLVRACLNQPLGRTPGEVTIDEFRAALGHREIAFRNYQHQQVGRHLTTCGRRRLYEDAQV